MYKKQNELTKMWRRANKKSLPSVLVPSIAAVVYKSTIYSPRSEFVIALMIVTQIRIYRVDIEDSGSLEGRAYTIDGYYCHHKLPAAATQESYHPSVLFLTPHLYSAGGGSGKWSYDAVTLPGSQPRPLIWLHVNKITLLQKLLHSYLLKAIKFLRRCAAWDAANINKEKIVTNHICKNEDLIKRRSALNS